MTSTYCFSCAQHLCTVQMNKVQKRLSIQNQDLNIFKGTLDQPYVGYYFIPMYSKVFRLKEPLRLEVWPWWLDGERAQWSFDWNRQTRIKFLSSHSEKSRSKQFRFFSLLQRALPALFLSCALTRHRSVLSYFGFTNCPPTIWVAFRDRNSLIMFFTRGMAVLSPMSNCASSALWISKAFVPTGASQNSSSLHGSFTENPASVSADACIPTSYR